MENTREGRFVASPPNQIVARACDWRVTAYPVMV
jgi:hypothetical protein